MRATVADNPTTNRAFACRATDFEALRRQVVALVDDDVSVVGDAIVHDALLDEALNDGDVDESVRPGRATADTTDRLRRQAEERRESLDPLIEQLAPMDEDQRVHAALGDQPRGDDGLAKRRRRGEHAGVVRQHRVCSGLLLASQLAAKRDLERAPVVAFVADDGAHAQIGQRLRTSSKHPRGSAMC